jgi:hypothetical protein
MGAPRSRRVAAWLLRTLGKESCMTFQEALAQQRWDDHRFYHHNRINQSLHLISALCFLCAYVLLFFEPAAAVLIAWLLAMPSRQIGHFFFEPHTYDHANQVTHEYKEDVKVGYNLRRKVVLYVVWVLSPVVLFIDPTLLEFVAPPAGWWSLLNNIAIVWLIVGVGAVLARTVQLFFLKDLQTGLVWAAKILTDPFHDVKLYRNAPLYVMRGELFDPIVSEDAA